MSLFERYKCGETVEVYKEIYALREDAFHPKHFEQVDLVLSETFRRVSFNIDIIFKELIDIGYQFNSAPLYNWQKPISPPHPDVEILLKQIKENLKPGR